MYVVHKIEIQRLRRGIKVTREKHAELRSVQYINNYRGNSLEDGTLIIGQSDCPCFPNIDLLQYRIEGPDENTRFANELSTGITKPGSARRVSRSSLVSILSNPRKSMQDQMIIARSKAAQL